MNLDIIKVGLFQTNCYIISNNNKVLIVDPGDEADKIKNKVGKKEVVGILLTHSHMDHVGALDEIVNYYQTKVYNNTNLVVGNNNVDIFNFEVRINKGHTNDSISFIFKELNAMFSGDFVFKLSIGRTDLGGNDIDMMNSINALLDSELPKELIIYPGHGDKTTLKFEKENNPYL